MYNEWHVSTNNYMEEEYRADCDHNIFMGHIEDEPDSYIYPIINS